MTRDEIIRMAREAGGTVMEPYDYGAEPDRMILRYGALDRFAALVAAAEREASSQLPTAKDSLPVGTNARRDAIELADALHRCCDELLIFGNDFSRPLIEAAAELRRLHGIEFALRDCEKALEGMAKKYMDAHDQRDELLTALRFAEFAMDNCPLVSQELNAAVKMARAAIAKATGEQA